MGTSLSSGTRVRKGFDMSHSSVNAASNQNESQYLYTEIGDLFLHLPCL